MDGFDCFLCHPDIAILRKTERFFVVALLRMTNFKLSLTCHSEHSEESLWLYRMIVIHYSAERREILRLCLRMTVSNLL